MNIRIARPEEVGSILAFWLEGEAVASVSDNLESVGLAVETGTFLVAIEDEKIIGTLFAGWDGWRGNMYRLAVHPNARRRGIALALVEEGERMLWERGARKIGAMVLHEHDQAIEFWRAAGYEHDARLWRFTKSRAVKDPLDDVVGAFDVETSDVDEAVYPPESAI